MMTVRMYLISITDCLTLGLNKEAFFYCEECQKYIMRFFREEEDYSDFYVLYGYICIINGQYGDAMETLESAQRELMEEVEKQK